MSSSTVVVGAGIAGLSAAVLMARQGTPVQVWESSSEPGGMLAPMEFCGIPCDLGSHRIHPQSDPLLRELTSEEAWLERPRRGNLVLNQRHIPYPPTPLPFLRGLGLEVSARMGWSWLTRPNVWERFLSWEEDRVLMAEEDEGFEDFVTARVGQAAYDSFYRPYVEKVWGLPPSEISRTVAKQRVSTSSPWQTLLGALKPGHTSKHHGKFLYPAVGMTGLIENLRKKAVELGVEFQYNRTLSLDHWPDSAEAVFFSGHLPSLVPDSGLSHRGLYVLFCAFPKGTLPAQDTWYTPESRYWFGRVSQPAQFSDSVDSANADVLCVEVPEGAWGRDVDFLSRRDELKEQLVDAGIVSKHAPLVQLQQLYLPHVYPMYRRNWYQRWQETMESLKSLGNAYPFGRQGLFLHCNMDHCVRMAQDVVEHRLRGGSSQEWLDAAHQYLGLRVRD